MFLLEDVPGVGAASNPTKPNTVKIDPMESIAVKKPIVKGYLSPAYTGPIDPMAQNDYWRNVGTTNNAMGQKVEQNINSGLTGAAFDPMAIQAQEGMARYEANQRAKNSAQIAGAGFAGTPVGALAANGMENDLARNRFDTNIGIETARQEHKLNAANAAISYADQTNKDRFNLDANRREEESQWYNNYRSATGELADLFLRNDKWQGLDANQLYAQPEVQALVKQFENAGISLNADNIKDYYDTVTDPVKTNTLLAVANELRNSGLFTEAQINDLVSKIVIGIYKWDEEKGAYVLDENKLNNGLSDFDSSAAEDALKNTKVNINFNDTINNNAFREIDKLNNNLNNNINNLINNNVSIPQIDYSKYNPNINISDFMPKY